MVKAHPCLHPRPSLNHPCHHSLRCVARKPPHPPTPRHPSHLAVAVLFAHSLQRHPFQQQQWRRPGPNCQGVPLPCLLLPVVAETGSPDMAGACAALDPCFLSPGPIPSGDSSSCFETSLVESTGSTEQGGEISWADEGLARLGSSSRGVEVKERCRECGKQQTETDLQSLRWMEVSDECSVRQLVAQADDGMCARQRLQQHHLQVAGNVSIPEAWGREQHLKDWLVADLVEDALRPPGLMLARNALINDSKARSKHLRVPASPPQLLSMSIDVEAS